VAERSITVCDVCGESAVETVGIRVGGRALNKDLCRTHLQDLVSNTRAPKRGRPRVLAAASSPTRRRAGRTRARKSAAARTTTAKRPRRRITDPVTLQKRRAALAKAREALAAKRAARKAG